MRILLSMPDPSTQSGFRDTVMLAVLYDSAARVQEIIDLKVKDLRLDKPAVIALHHQFRRRYVPIMEKTQNLLKTCLEKNKEVREPATVNNMYLKTRKNNNCHVGGFLISSTNTSIWQGCSDGFNIRFSVLRTYSRHSKSVHLLPIWCQFDLH